MKIIVSEEFLEIRGRVDAEFRRNSRLHKRRMKCCAGCTDCCHQLFSISELEAGRVSQAVKEFEPLQRKEVSVRAERYVTERETILRQHGYVESAGNLPKPHLRLACPLLENGHCLIYEDRPLLCRKIGMPLVHPTDSTRVAACELNFRPGETFEDPRLVPIQTSIQQDWVALLKRFNNSGGQREELPITVADAVLRDFRGV